MSFSLESHYNVSVITLVSLGLTLLHINL